MGLIFFSITIYSYKNGAGKKDAANFAHEPHLPSEAAGESGLARRRTGRGRSTPQRMETGWGWGEPGPALPCPLENLLLPLP